VPIAAEQLMVSQVLADMDAARQARLSYF
jgi:hypothetical protein